MARRKKSADSSSSSCRLKKSSNFSKKLGSRNEAKPQQRNAANARERARMRVLSRAFCRLKTTLPWVPADTKLSKLDTLRLASSYISHLKKILEDESDPFETASRNLVQNDNIYPSRTLSWPFGFKSVSCPRDGSLTDGTEEEWDEEFENEEEEEEENVNTSKNNNQNNKIMPTKCIHLLSTNNSTTLLNQTTNNSTISTNNTNVNVHSSSGGVLPIYSSNLNPMHQQIYQMNSNSGYLATTQIY